MARQTHWPYKTEPEYLGKPETVTRGKEGFVVTERDLAYAAGIIDGEGTIGIYPHSAATNTRDRRISVLRIRVAVPQCDIRLPQWFKSTFGYGYINCGGVPKSGRRIVWVWSICGFKQAVPFLELIRPYLLLKRDRADIALTFARQNKNIRHLPEPEKSIEIAQRQALVAKLKECNRRGILSPAETERFRAEKSAMRQSELQGNELAEAIRNTGPSSVGGNIK
jgi:hypothetical protein